MKDLINCLIFGAGYYAVIVGVDHYCSENSLFNKICTKMFGETLNINNME